jgi:hypothetical protein
LTSRPTDALAWTFFISGALWMLIIGGTCALIIAGVLKVRRFDRARRRRPPR